MLRVHLMPRSHDAALQQREGRFYGVSVNVAVSIFAGVIDRAMFVLLNLVERPRVDARFVGHNHFDVTSEIGFDDLAHSIRSGIPCMDQAQIAVTLPDTNDHFLDARRTPSALLTTYVGFVNLYGATERLWRYFLHGFADSMAEIPRRLVAHANRALNLERGHTLLGLAKQGHSDKPLPKGQVRIMEDRASSYAKLVMA